MESHIKKCNEIGIKDVGIVGGKNASLGEIYNQLTLKGVAIPNGFATTSYAFWEFLKDNKIETLLKQLLTKLNRKDYSNLETIGQQARVLILSGSFSSEFSKDIKKSYASLCDNDLKEVAVRSSATAEDLPDASFAGQHETYLNIKGEDQLLEAVKECFASLYTNRAIKYREDKGFKHHDIALSVGVQSHTAGVAPSSAVYRPLPSCVKYRCKNHLAQSGQYQTPANHHSQSPDPRFPETTD